MDREIIFKGNKVYVHGIQVMELIYNFIKSDELSKEFYLNDIRYYLEKDNENNNIRIYETNKEMSAFLFAKIANVV